MASKKKSVSACMKRLGEAVLDAAEKNIEKGLSIVPDEVADELRNTSPEQSGTYKQGWTTSEKTIKGQKHVIVHNASEPRLTHLLENGHISKNQFGQYGRVKPQKHIKPAEKNGAAHFMEILSEDLNIDCEDQTVEV